MKQYKLQPYDKTNDIWILYKRVLFVFWKAIQVGPRKVFYCDTTKVKVLEE